MALYLNNPQVIHKADVIDRVKEAVIIGWYMTMITKCADGQKATWHKVKIMWRFCKYEGVLYNWLVKKITMDNWAPTE